MENLGAHFDQEIKKIEELGNAIILLHEKYEKNLELKRLNNNNKNVMELMDLVKIQLNLYKTEQELRFKEIMKKLQAQQITMLNIIEKLDENTEPEPSITSYESPEKVLYSQTPRSSSVKRSMYLHEFQKSPFVNKIRPLALNFLDFEIQISNNDFNNIPKYMKGRESVDDLNEFLENVIVKCFNEKYTLLHKKREAVKACDRNLWILFNEQNKYFPGRKFITPGDISRCLDRLIDKKINNYITMLKHLKVLKENRKGSTICYLWEVEKI